MNIYGRSKERKSDLDIKPLLYGLLLGLIVAITLIILGNGSIYLVKLIIKYWILFVGSILGLIVLRKFIKQKKQEQAQQITYNNYYQDPNEV